MKILSWNARGLNNHRKQRLLRKKVKNENPDMIFLQETKCSSQKMKGINKNLGKRMDYTEVEGNGMEGGLATFGIPSPSIS